MWLILAFLSAALLGFYDSFKKKALEGNAVIPILFLNTLFSSLIFLPFIIVSYTTDALDGSLFHVASGGWETHKYIIICFGAGCKSPPAVKVRERQNGRLLKLLLNR